MSDHAVRAAKATDERAILDLAGAEMRAHETIDPRFKLRPDADARYAVYLRDRIRDIDSAVFIAETDGRALGMIVASVRSQESFYEARRYGYVSDLVVTRAARRGGVGRSLWERASLWFKGLGVSVVRLHVAVRSDEARAFWKSVGARDFLCEAWVDLPSGPATAPGTAAPAGSEDRPAGEIA